MKNESHTSKLHEAIDAAERKLEEIAVAIQRVLPPPCYALLLLPPHCPRNFVARICVIYTSILLHFTAQLCSHLAVTHTSILPHFTARLACITPRRSSTTLRRQGTKTPPTRSSSCGSSKRFVFATLCVVNGG